MTTIATDGKSMAGDSQSTAGGSVVAYRSKVFKTADGRIFGCCGCSTDAAKFKRWMLEGGEQPKLGDDFSALVLNQDGTVDWWDEHYTPLRTMLPTAIGSGCEYAIGAMLAGAEPVGAVAIAITRDTGSGGDVTVEAL